MQKRLLLVALIQCLALSVAHAQVTTESLLGQLADPDFMPKFRAYTLHEFSSAAPDGHPAGRNSDVQNFLRTYGDEAVLAEMDGPGAIVRMWTADPGSVHGHIKIYLDEEVRPDGQEASGRPSVDVNFSDFMHGIVYPFLPPLVQTFPGGPVSSAGGAFRSGGAVSFFPIPFARKCKVIVEKPDFMYYQITYAQFAPGTNVVSYQRMERVPPFTGWSAVEKTLRYWQNPVASRKPLTDLGSDVVLPGETRQWRTDPLVSVAGQIEALHVATSYANQGSSERINPAYWRKLVLRVTFDDHLSPDIEAPLADLFGNPFAEQLVTETGLWGSLVDVMKANLFLSKDVNGQGATLFLPMPFGNMVRISVENGNDRAVVVSLSANWKQTAFDATTTGYLHARYMEELVTNGVPHFWLDTHGDRGHFVGVVQAMTWSAPPGAPPNSLGFLEGDDQFWVDAQVPSGGVDSNRNAPFNGTGTEDYFNSANYFSGGVAVFPLQGMTYKEEQNPGSVHAAVSAFRWHILDSPSFTHAIVADIEHGGANDVAGAYYASTVFWYSSGEAQPRRLTMPKAAAIPLLEQHHAVPRTP